MSRKWVTPRAEIEGFTANEYCSACWGVKCNIEDANEYEDEYDFDEKGIYHTPDHCGLATNQVIKDLDGDGTADLMQEVGTDGLGTLECKIYENDRYLKRIDVGTVKPENYIYWTTSSADGRTWHHQGYVFATVDGHPNRS